MFQKLQAQLEPHTSKISSAYQSLNSRERMIVTGGSIVFGFAIAYLLIWSPIYNSSNKAESDYIHEIELHHWMKSKAPMITGGSANKEIKPINKSLLSLVNETARNFKLTLKNAESKGEDSIRIRLDEGVSDSVLKWIYHLYNTYGIQVSSIGLEEQDTPGKVRVNLVLAKI